MLNSHYQTNFSDQTGIADISESCEKAEFNFYALAAPKKNEPDQGR